MRAKLRRFWQAPAAGQRLLLETAFQLLFAQLLLRLLPFRWLVWWFERPARQPELQGAARRATCDEIRTVIYFANAWFSINAVCFPLSMAAQAMLRRRGVSTTLYYGAATLPDHGRLTAHVWLQDGDEGVVAHENLAQFQILAHYSSLQQQLP